ncbi:MAG: endolytic transglycosylase MltG [Chlorobiales bacterium]|nr:endolytic transglycosylase MltG [Chlorobiales bacterium]
MTEFFRRLLRAITKLAFLFVMFIVVLLAFGYIYLFKSTLNSYTYEQPKLIKVHRGASYLDIVDELQKNEIIKTPLPLKVLGYVMPEARKIKPGRYYIPSGLTSAELLRFLYTRHQDETRIRIPEGTSGKEISAILDGSVDFDTTSFMQAFSDPALLKEFGVEGKNFEGYLLPDTYNLPWASTAEDVVRALVKHFRTFYNDSLQAAARKAGLTELEVLTLASIVEAETSLKSERPVVAGVYLNRLRKGMPLQADPTVMYALGGERRRLLYKDLKVDSPYNTYLYQGLPPGPIGNPSRESILAVLYPEKTNYIYFVATGSGGHNFSQTLAEHYQNVQKYRVVLEQKKAEKLALKDSLNLSRH